MNHKEEIKKPLMWFIYLFSGMYVIVWILLAVFPLGQDLIKTGYQFVYSKFRSHNNLGNFLILPLIGCMYYLFHHKSKKVLLLLFGLVIFVLFSYSRSAYLSLIIILIYMFFSLKKYSKHFLYTKIFLLIIGVLSIFFLITVRESQDIPLLKSIHQSLSQNFALQEKTLFSRRIDFIEQIASENYTRYIVGVGPGNFGIISKKHAQSIQSISETSHNIFLDLLVENGIVALVIFILFLYYVWKHADKKNVYFFFVLAMLLNFQTDYTFRIYSFFLLFFIFIGLVYKGENVRMKNPLLFSSMLLFVVVLSCLSMFWVFKNNYPLAFAMNPLNKTVYMPLIEEKKLPISLYERLFSEDAEVFADIGAFYERGGDTKKAIPYYQKSFALDKFRDNNLFFRIYTLLVTEHGSYEANKYYAHISKEVFPGYMRKNIPHEQRKNLYLICLYEQSKLVCLKKWVPFR